MALKNGPSVVLDQVCFEYPVFELTGRSLKVTVMRQFAGGKASAENGFVTVQALKDVSFSLKSGDRLGLVGRNGSGKSTLLRLLARLAYPQRGSLTIRGRVVPLIERGLGINPELSGFTNIELPLRLLGANTAEVRAAKEWIPDFTGLGEFMNLPVRTYSEGMKTRLSFAISTALSADLLVLDEWLSAGDIEFHERAQERLKSLLDDTAIVVLASHSMELLKEVCTAVAWIDRGHLIMIGNPQEVIAAYQNSMQTRATLVSVA
jgi:ABC-type polysaccharide/polyol phosphate transport system ATPase subunit